MFLTLFVLSRHIALLGFQGAPPRSGARRFTLHPLSVFASPFPRKRGKIAGKVRGEGLSARVARTQDTCRGAIRGHRLSSLWRVQLCASRRVATHTQDTGRGAIRGHRLPACGGCNCVRRERRTHRTRAGLPVLPASRDAHTGHGQGCSQECPQAYPLFLITNRACSPVMFCSVSGSNGTVSPSTSTQECRISRFHSATTSRKSVILHRWMFGVSYHL